MLIAPAGHLSLPGKAIYNTESSGAVHKELAKNPDYVCSEYFGEGYESGQIVNGAQHQDLCSLSFDDGSFDLVLSSDVLEHMPSPYDAHREIFRVLKPGGRHLFTVPFIESQVDDQIRARIVDGKVEYLREKIFHGDPVRPGEGVLVWVVFGIGMMKKLEEVGFRASCWSLYEPDHGIIGNHQLVFEALKPSI
jgi:SAM-dependent methyltransferase